VKMQQRRWLQNDGGPQNPRREHEKSAQPDDNSVGNSQVGSAFATAIEDQC
jgi:hypothetical protein